MMRFAGNFMAYHIPYPGNYEFRVPAKCPALLISISNRVADVTCAECMREEQAWVEHNKVNGHTVTYEEVLQWKSIKRVQHREDFRKRAANATQR